MWAALAATHIVGPYTNVSFLRRAVGTRSFAQADLDTALIEREGAALFDAPPLPLEVAAAGVSAHLIAAECALEGTDPWSRRDVWRFFGGARRRFEIAALGARHAVGIERGHDGQMRLADSRGRQAV
jgi:3-methylcrotonyl-CoA carboxylase alpha subunit